MDLQIIFSKVKDINVTDLAGEKVMIDFASGKYFMLRGVGGEIWELIDGSRSIEAIVNELMKEYDISEEVCQKEVIAFIQQLMDAGFVA